VADGYVSGATVYVYNDAGMTNPIGFGSTDASGDFSITLSVSSLPDPVYLKSVGGSDMATGMPAPTMLFVASGASDTFNITPFTDSLYKYGLTLGIDGATQHLTGQLGISSSDLYDDPVTKAGLSNALNRILSSGTMEGTLADGEYIVELIYLSQENTGDSYEEIADILATNRLEMTVTITDGLVNGTVEIQQVPWVVTGKVQGSSIVLTIVDNLDPVLNNQLIRITGSIGLLGSVAGVYTDLDRAGLDLYKGIFVATFIPASGLDPNGVTDVISNVYSGSRHTIFRDIFSGEYKLTWGDITITDIDPQAGTVTAGDSFMVVDNGSDPNDPNFALPSQEHLFFSAGVLLETSGGLPANIIILEFDVLTQLGAKAFLIQPVGSRKGIYMAVDFGGSPYAIGDAYMATGEGFAPSLDSTTNYEVKVAVAHAGMLNSPRANWIGAMPYSDNFTTPDISGGTDHDFTGNLLKVFNGSLVAFKNDDNDGGLDNDFTVSPDGNGEPDFIRLVELYETGAIQGEEITGGDSPNGDPFSYCPATFVGFMKKQGETAPNVSGALNFLARVLYSTDLDTYLNAYVTGNLSLSGSSGTLNWTDPGGTSGTASLTAEKTDGLYHMHGNLNSNIYIDIFWPVGGKKAVYITSNNGSGQWIITEVGEAYLTH